MDSVAPPGAFRLALLLDEPWLERWQRQLLDRLHATGEVEIVAVWLLARRRDLHDAPAGWARYLSADARRFAPHPDPAERLALATILPDVPVRAVDDDASASPLPSDLLISFESVSYPVPSALDALLRRSDRPLWTLTFGQSAPEGRPRWARALDEVHRAAPTTHLALHEHRADAPPVTIAGAATETSFVSPAITLARLRWLALEVLAREIGKRATGRVAPTIGPVASTDGGERGRAIAADDTQAVDRAALPSPLGFAAARVGAYVARGVSERVREERWELGYRFAPLSDDDPLVRDGQGARLTVADFVPLRPPRGRYWADPHVLAIDGGWQVYVEDYPMSGPARERRGRITTFTLDADGRTGEPQLALECPWHLSYPFVFRDGGSLFMVPETGAHRTIDLYECIDFPHRWALRRTLMRDVYAVDTTLWHDGERWWLFTALAENPGKRPHDELHLFSSTRLDTDRWERHATGAIVSDPHRARPAGALFEHAGRLYRPAQDGVGEYGRAVRLMEVTALEPLRYAEREVGLLEPPAGGRMRGVHTFARAPGITMIDTKWRPWRSPAFNGFGR